MASKKKYSSSKKTATAPLTLQEKVSRYMRGNKARDTKPELLLRKQLWQAGLRGYRVHWPKAPGKPDICYPGRKLAIFVHGCFWHRCPYCQPSLPKSNVAFWQNKFERNIARDATYRTMYREAGWTCICIWECQLYADTSGCLTLIRELHQGVPASWEVAA
ncbi:very short patch repair endonuclease [Pontibacter qinzhouensis]|uniref:Very short patch repair endonuclease n=1 Tax=Pontibacter qinzhouensis TaxID=2603253 RepID=A0A5C8IH79_9BACT|nr:very short patch repair endonuclease [Pontibacter qinzhouensis]TXK21059.1 very short patch repair endonuclease [Pontibacter qinzhouensis]